MPVLKKINPNPFTTRPEIEGTFGVVASTHWIATAVGMSILEKGGNAFDAGCAIAFTLQVVEPHLNGPGGDVPIMIYDARRERAEVICGQGPAPAGLTIAHLRGLGLDLVPGAGMLAPCIPGTFDAWMIMLLNWGTMRLADVLAPAISYARNGHPLVERASATIATVADLFRDHWHSSAAVYLPGGDVPRPGSIFTNTAMAATYERIVREAEAASWQRDTQIEAARRVWSQGFVAEAVDRFCRSEEVMDVTGQRNRAVLTGADMAGWQATVEEPIGFDYGNYRVLKPGPWTQGLVALQQLALLKDIPLDAFDPTGPDFIHLVVEASKLAFADRETFYGDPNFTDVPIEVLLSPAYNDARRALIGETASLELRPGSISGFGGKIDARVSGDRRVSVGSLGTGEPTVGQIGDPDGDTVHFDVVDRHGNMVAATASGGWLQSSPVIPELGFPLGTRAQMFWLDESHPAALVPGKRPRSTLSPTLALRDGRPYLAWGSPGGDQQDQWTVQFFLRHAAAGMNLQESIDAPAWHSEHFPSSFWPRMSRPGALIVEGRLPTSTVEELKRRGHAVEVGEDWSEGRLVAASIDGQRRRAAANPRGMQGYAAGR
ncbi:gamma-glutamyltransferase family protein [Ancylobacter mangrovi]|uniref:gamma-glutamyltransferase family protein n=1 Tax=Ancylobacter mangrovi TaxID=2972472 RepID=UPI0035A8E157